MQSLLQKFFLFILLLGLCGVSSTVAYSAKENACKEIDSSRPEHTATHLLLQSKSIFDSVTQRDNVSPQLKELDSILNCISSLIDWAPKSDDPRDLGFAYNTLLAGDDTNAIELIEKISSVAMAVRYLGFHDQAIAIQELAVELDMRGNSPSTQLFSISRLALLQIENADHLSAEHSLDVAANLTLQESVTDLAITEYLDVTCSQSGP